MHTGFKLRPALFGAVAYAAFAPAAFAQSVQTAAATQDETSQFIRVASAAESATSPLGIAAPEQVTVTARRREENAQDVPIALSVVTVALCAEMTGGMQRMLDIAVEYAKTRKQFGKPIGIFQAVQQLCADMYLETESSRSATYYAAWALEENMPDAAASVSVAKMYASDAARGVGNRGIQVHGGMGFTWENDIHLYYRRAKASETMLGDATFHRERIARLVIDGASSNKKSRVPEQAALASK